MASPTDFNERKHLLKSVVHFKPDAVYNRELRQHTVRALKKRNVCRGVKTGKRKGNGGKKKRKVRF